MSETKNPQKRALGRSRSLPDAEVSPNDIYWYTEHLALLVSTSKWALLGALTGVLVGLATRLFLLAISYGSHFAGYLSTLGFHLYWLLPFALVASVWLVRTFAPDAKGHGTEQVIEAVHERHGQIDARVAPVKLLATVVTITFGGSVGKEGPAAQIGAAITSTVANWLRLSLADRRRLVICGIAAGFASVFGTPISGALFGIEVLYLGRIEYSVLFPCLVAGIVAHLVCGTTPPTPLLSSSIEAGLGKFPLVLWSIAFGVICGLAGLLLIESMLGLNRLLDRFRQYPYPIALVGGVLLATFYYLFGTETAGLGVQTIGIAMAGVSGVALSAFALKIATTAITLETGGSGGILTPLFFIGSTLGYTFADLLHLPRALFAAFGFIAVVAGAANTPIALSVMGMEILPGNVGVYAALCACTAYLIVGHRSVYSSQRLGISKTAALEMDLDVPIGSFNRKQVTLIQGTLTHRLSNLRRKKREP